MEDVDQDVLLNWVTGSPRWQSTHTFRTWDQAVDFWNSNNPDNIISVNCPGGHWKRELVKKYHEYHAAKLRETSRFPWLRRIVKCSAAV